jgi:superfamily II DNA/RNA helicase
MKDQEKQTFSDFNLHPNILKAISFPTPTEIQAQAIPKAMAGFDIYASAQTGTGKTASFVLPALNRLMTPSTIKGHGPRILILVPTRELAMQVAEEAIKYSEFLSKTKTVCIYGGAPYPFQNKQLSLPYEILVATPGRLIDHLSRGRINLARVEMLILDEADRMLDMGFIKPVEQIAEETPKSRQTLMFSATLKKSVLKLSKSLLNNPQEISISAVHAKHENIEQQLYYLDNINAKNQALDYLLTNMEIKQAIIFTSTKRQADQLLYTLRDRGHYAAALHGDINQRQRTQTISQVREGKVQFLVATDVAARGIDIKTISHVINFDLPNSTEDYVHRIGRTGRADQKGIALSFVTPRDRGVLREIEQFTGQKILSQTIPGMEPQPRQDFRSERPAFKPKRSFQTKRYV